MTTEQTSDDNAARRDGSGVERGVRPRALLLAHKDGRETLHPMSEYAVAYRDTAVSEVMLYDRAAIDAAVAAERERWQKWACRKEWDNVNDPPCHPSDKGWRPCDACEGPNSNSAAAPAP